MRIALIITARPSYAKFQPILTALLNRGADVTVIACASALLERYGRVVDVIRKDFPGVPIDEIYSTYEGATLVTSTKETGALLVDLGAHLHRMSATDVLVMADRHEVLAAAQAGAYLHLRVHHVQGGETSGSIDDRVRDAITQLSTRHYVSTEQARNRVYGLTGDWQAIHVTGCPSIDLAKQAQCEPRVTIDELGGSGASVQFDQLGDGFVIVLQHPVTSEMEQAAEQMRITLEACRDWPALVFWPGQDAGADAISKVIRLHQGRVHTVRNLPPSRFLRLLTQSACLIGNSSAGIRECSYLGVPVVNIGTRQWGRERAHNVIDVPHDEPSIRGAIVRQLEHGAYTSSSLYGSGNAGERIAEVLVGNKTATVHSRVR